MRNLKRHFEPCIHFLLFFFFFPMPKFRIFQKRLASISKCIPGFKRSFHRYTSIVSQFLGVFYSTRIDRMNLLSPITYSMLSEQIDTVHTQRLRRVVDERKRVIRRTHTISIHTRLRKYKYVLAPNTVIIKTGGFHLILIEAHSIIILETLSLLGYYTWFNHVLSILIAPFR